MDANTQETQETQETTQTLMQMIAAGLAHHQSGRFAEAKNIYMEVLAADPENFDALHLLGVLAHQFGNHELAVDLIEKAVLRNAENPGAFNNLGEAYKGAKRLDQAERCYRRALELKPDFAEVCSNLGMALKGLGRLDEAVQVYREALDLKPDFVLVHYNLGNVLKDLGELDEAQACFSQALALKPDFADASTELAKLQLLRGDYQQGLNFFQQSFTPGGDGSPAARRERVLQLQGQQRWQDEPLEGRRLLLVAEQGAGDNLMMMRYLPLLAARGLERLLVYATPNLARLFLNMDGVEVVSMTEPLPVGSFDLFCPMISLPWHFPSELEAIPAETPYLRLPAELSEHWRARLAEVSGAKVGLCWAAGKLSSTHARRSVPLEEFQPLLDVPGLRLVNLQKGKEAAQLPALGWEIFDCMSECRDFQDTAGLIEQLDLVISVDTAVAHLAGAMGKPVWLLNSFESDWRWMLERNDSPWYPSMRIFRQAERGDWHGVIDEISEQLALFAALSA